MADPNMPGAGEPKIIIDSDWKAQAQREKERLAQQEREAAEKAAKRPVAGQPAQNKGGEGRSPAGEDDVQELPPADFPALVGTLFTQAVLYLGGIPDPQTGRAIVSLEHARFHIDLLAMLEEKTKGNLSAEEASDLSQVLNELRMRFVEISKAVMQMQAKQAMQAAGGGAGGGAGELGGMMPNLKLRRD
jgi:hypothetical protein